MPGRHNSIDSGDKEYQRLTPRKRRGKGRFIASILVIGLALFIIFLPSLLTRPAIVRSALNRFAGVHPLRINLNSLKAGWFSPVSVQGIEVTDGQGHVVARIGAVETDKSLVGWILDQSDLGTIRLKDVEAAIVAANGTTNIEESLKFLWENTETPEQDDPSESTRSLPTGTVELNNAKFLVMELKRPEQWVVQISQLKVVLPASDQIVGPIDMQATVSEMSGTVPGSVGQIAAEIQQSVDSQALNGRAKLVDVPIACWHVLRARFPDLPVEELRGRVSGTLSGGIFDEGRWAFDVQQLETKDFQVVAPSLVGENPASLVLMTATGRATLADARLNIADVKFACDFASAGVSAEIPWPLNIPTAAEPFLAGATVAAQGTVDLPRLAAAAESLLPLRKDIQFRAGTAQFAVNQTLSESGVPTSRAKLQLSGLQASASGQQLTWAEPLTLEVAADQGTEGLRVGAQASADFCQLKLGGTLSAGQLSGDVDLDLLQQRLSQWVELPVRTMTGGAEVDLQWNRIADTTIEAKATLKTSPLEISSTTGGQLKEPAWSGSALAEIGLTAGMPDSLLRAQLSLQSQAEQVTVDLQERLYFSQDTQSQLGTNQVPAAFAVSLVTDLANCKRRGDLWLTEPPEVDLAGNLSLAVSGLVDINHVEILQANWRSQPLQVTAPQVGFNEAQMMGSFKGRVDTNDVTRLVVEKLEVQSTSFSIGARDAIASDGSGSRVGQARFLVNLDQLLKNMNSSVPVNSALSNSPAPVAATAQLGATGMIDGQLAWQVNSQTAAVNIQANGKDIFVTSVSPGVPVTPLWNESQVVANMSGDWQASTGAIKLDSLQIQTPWMNYSGNVTYTAGTSEQSIGATGQAVYDSVQLSQKLNPYTGGQLLLQGRQTIPINLTWTSSQDQTQSMFKGLAAQTRIGWEKAFVAGIELGKADVPVSIQDGQLATAAEFPVSGGMLRWDVASDLTADDLVFFQKPMTVLENVEITEQMCQGWLKYIAPLLAETTSIDGRLSLRLDRASLTPAEPKKQTVAGQLVIHNAQVGPGPLSNQVIVLVKQLDAIRKKELTQPVSSQKVWLNVPEQRVDFEMVNGRVVHRNLSAQIGDAAVSTAGSVDVDGNIEMLANMPIPDDWIQKSPWLVGLKGQSLQFPVRGTLSKPLVDTQMLSQLGRQTVQSAASGALQQGLTRGLEKLFGGQIPVPPQPVANP